jgi:hypothetical protein
MEETLFLIARLNLDEKTFFANKNIASNTFKLSFLDLKV